MTLKMPENGRKLSAAHAHTGAESKDINYSIESVDHVYSICCLVYFFF